MENKTPSSTQEAGAASCYTDVITIHASPAMLLEHLADLDRHPAWVPDGFKLYQRQSGAGKQEGATAALQLNLLGHWMPGTLRIERATEQEVRWSLTLEYVFLTAHFTLTGRESRTEVRLAVSTGQRALPFWRIRSRLKRHLRLDRDAVTLFERCLSMLKQAAEKAASARPESKEATTAPRPAQPAPPSTGGVTTGGASTEGASTPGSSKPSASEAQVRDQTAAAPAPVASSAVSAPAPEKPVVVKPMAASVSIRRPVIPPVSDAPAEEKKVVMGAASRPVLEGVDAKPVGNVVGGSTDPASSTASGKGEGASGGSTPTVQGKSSQTGSMVNGLQAMFPVGELEVGKGRSVVINGRKIAVFRVEEGFFGLADQCPHRHNPLATGTLSGCNVTCAAHGWTFDVTNGTSTNVLGAGVLRFEVSVRDGQVWVNPRPLRPTFPSE